MCRMFRKEQGFARGVTQIRRGDAGAGPTRVTCSQGESREIGECAAPGGLGISDARDLGAHPSRSILIGSAGSGGMVLQSVMIRVVLKNCGLTR